MGVCSSRAFLIHKWVEISRFFQTAEPGRRDAAGACTPQTSHKHGDERENVETICVAAWGIVVLVAIGLLVACGSNYNPSSDGLVLVASQGSGLIETFSFNLYNGHLSEISQHAGRHIEPDLRSEGRAVVDGDRSEGEHTLTRF